MRFAVVLDDLAGLALLGGGTTSTISWPAPAQPTCAGVDAEVGDGQLVDGLGLGGHDPLEGGVAGLDHTGGHRDHGGQRALDLVVALLGLALDLDAVPSAISICLAKVTDGRSRSSAICSGTVPV